MSRWQLHTHPIDTCASCLAWGIIFARRLCAACYMFERDHEAGDCRGCGRRVALTRAYCRLCWDQARTLAHVVRDRKVTAVNFIAEVREHQLFLGNMVGGSRLRSGASPRRSRPTTTATEAVAQDPDQLALFAVTSTGFAYDENLYHPTVSEQVIRWAHGLVDRVAESQGWKAHTSYLVRRSLAFLLADYVDGDRLTHSAITTALLERGWTLTRPIMILRQMGLYVDDRRPPLDTYLATKLAEVAPAIAAAAEQWIRGLVTGDTRHRPRTEKTARRYLFAVTPALLAWSQEHEHLREVTRDDVLAQLKPLRGNDRQLMLIALRSLFSTAKKNGSIFRNPTSRIRVGAAPTAVLQPLPDDRVQQAVKAAARPADPLILALATIHAARPLAMRRLLLDDIDLGNRLLTIDQHVRPLDELTRRAVLHWLDHRRATWPTTPNRHLFITTQTAITTTPVSEAWLTETFRHGTTLEQLRIDRQLEEALTHHADPLHLAMVFGIHQRTALRYADSARQLLTTATEHDSTG